MESKGRAVIEGPSTAGTREIVDPWVHRSDSMRCRTCMWYVPKPSQGPTAWNSVALGRCRRHAPTMSGYPVVFDRDWCGDHKLDEEKV